MMVKLMLNEGFTMIEALLTILIMGLFTFLYTANKSDINYNQQTQINTLSNDLLNLQIESLIYKEKNCLNDGFVSSNYPICFNQNGNSNMAQSISLIDNNFSITIFLGAGSHEIKQR